MLQIYNIPANFNRLAVLILDAAWTFAFPERNLAPI